MLNIWILKEFISLATTTWELLEFPSAAHNFLVVWMTLIGKANIKDLIWIFYDIYSKCQTIPFIYLSVNSRRQQVPIYSGYLMAAYTST